MVFIYLYAAEKYAMPINMVFTRALTDEMECSKLVCSPRRAKARALTQP